MAIIITDECINCGACEPECPNNAIYEGGVDWAMKDGTGVTGTYTLSDGKTIDANSAQKPVSDDYYFICVLYTSPSPRDRTRSRMPSSA